MFVFNLVRLMPKVDSISEMLLRDPVHASDVGLGARRQAATDLGAEPEEIVAAVGVCGHSWALADHELDVVPARKFVRVSWQLEDFAILPSALLIIDMPICADDFGEKCSVGSLVCLSRFQPREDAETAVEAHV